MKYRPLGRTGVRVSQLCLGTMAFGGDADVPESRAMYKAAREIGINFFDTADQYNAGKSEQVLGELMRGHRDELVIATKGFNPTGSDINAKGSSRRHIVRACEASLQRLGTDRIDVYYLHHHDARTPLEEAMRGLEDLVRAGKVLYPALSNHAAWQTQRAIDHQQAQGWARIEVVQPMYNLIKRTAEIEILPMAQANEVSVVPYSPAAGGILSGKYGSDAKSVPGRLNQSPMYATRYGEEGVLDCATQFAALAKRRGVHPVSLAVAWVGSHPAVTAPIVGARSAEQLQASLDALKIDMTPELRAEVSALSHTPPPATDRLEEVAAKKK